MSKERTGWLINDMLTSIPGTKTFWHDLLENVPNLIDKTGGYTDFSILPFKIEQDLKNSEPNYIIRNASYFRRLQTKIPTISLLQDITNNHDVCYSSDIVVANSSYVVSQYDTNKIKNLQIIPLGIDFTFFNIDKDYSEELGILPNSILFIGASNSYPKGFDLLTEIIDKTNYNFCLIMKDDYKINHPRIKVFNRVNAVTVKKIINSCKLCLCTSKVETQHLAGLEAAACNLPLLTTNVGVYYNRPDGDWGKVCNSLDDFLENIKYTLNNLEKFSSRKYFLNEGFDKKECMAKWKKLCEEI